MGSGKQGAAASLFSLSENGAITEISLSGKFPWNLSSCFCGIPILYNYCFVIIPGAEPPSILRHAFCRVDHCTEFLLCFAFLFLSFYQSNLAISALHLEKRCKGKI